MLKEIVSESEWKDVKEFISPSTFKVVPLLTATRQFRKIAKNHWDEAGFDRAVAQRQQWLDQVGMPIRATTEKSVPLGDGAMTGEQVLQLYFHQIYYGDVALLDLRYARFGAKNGQVEWAPQAYWFEWEDDFQQAARDLYVGFYTDDEERFEGALDLMGIRCAEDVFLEHFGAGEQREVGFKMEYFLGTFRQTLHRCKRQGRKIHPNLIPFGIYLVTLYDHLEHLGGEYDVRKAYHAAIDVEQFAN